MKSCANCGAQMPDVAKFCPKCGRSTVPDITKSQEHISEKSEKMQSSGARTLVIVLVILCAVLIGIVAVGYQPFIYEKAENLLARGQFEEAIDNYQKILSYKDADIREKETLYQWALSYFNQSDFENARDLFGRVGDYKDSLDMTNECSYQEGLIYETQGDYERALNAFVSLQQYGDAPEAAKRVANEWLDHLIDLKDYTTGLVVAQKMSDGNIELYIRGLMALEDMDELAALSYFVQLPADYRDVSIQLESICEPTYQRGVELESSSYADALEYFRKLPSSYKDVQMRVATLSQYEDLMGTYLCVSYIQTWFGIETECVDSKANNDERFTVEVFSTSDGVVANVPYGLYGGKQRVNVSIVDGGYILETNSNSKECSYSPGTLFVNEDSFGVPEKAKWDKLSE